MFFITKIIIKMYESTHKNVQSKDKVVKIQTKIFQGRIPKSITFMWHNSSVYTKQKLWKLRSFLKPRSVVTAKRPGEFRDHRGTTFVSDGLQDSMSETNLRNDLDLLNEPQLLLKRLKLKHHLGLQRLKPKRNLGNVHSVSAFWATFTIKFMHFAVESQQFMEVKMLFSA